MKVVSIGGGPAGLYFGILMKLADRRHEVTVLERNRPDDTFGFGVVFSDATLNNLARADEETYRAIRQNFAHWDDIETHIGGQVVTSTGHGFCGMERKLLLHVLQRRCQELGVALRFETEVTDLDSVCDADLVLGADGVASGVRQARSQWFEPRIDVRPNRFVWLGTTFPFRAFTFYFQESEHGLFRVHAYRYSDDRSTFIVECTGDTFARTGLREEDEDATIAYLERVFARQLAGHRLIKNRSIWRSFPTVRNARWHHQNVVLVGDAAHTAHFSIGSGTKLAMEDAIALSTALGECDDVSLALTRYEAARRPEVEALQRAAQVSLEWFENTERYLRLSPLQFTFSLLTRSLRVGYAGMRKRDPDLVRQVESAFSRQDVPPPPHRVALRVRGIDIPSRIVRAWTGAEIPAGTGMCVVDRAALDDVAIAAVRGAGAVLAVSVAASDAAGAASAVARGARAIEVDVSALAADVARSVAAARAAAGPEVLLVARVGGVDAVALARAAIGAGADIVRAAAPPAGPGSDPVPPGLAELALADRVRNEAGCATIADGPVRSSDDIDSALAAGRCDLFAVSTAARR